MKPHHWRVRVIAAIAGPVLALATFGSPAIATAVEHTTDAAIAAASPPAATGVAALAAGSATGTRVTLITGDAVTYHAGGSDGGEDVQITAAPRPDGRPVAFHQLRRGDDYYVIPSDALGLVGTGRLDLRLFDVAYLVGNGYGDNAAAQTPVIAQYGAATRSAQALSQQADALPGNTSAQPLTAVHGAAFRVAKSTTNTFWKAVGQPAHGTLTPRALPADGLSKIWLDAKVTADLDESVPQIGAPEAWQAGFDGSGVKVAVLDTGVDLSHPDLADKIGATANFSTESSVQDGNGHGTHVASTIAGNGAASGGRYKGVAPGATLLIGKVLNNSGSGLTSKIIEGMQWAAGQGADIVNLSLGSSATNGTDPASEAVDDLTAQTGTLFVIAGGNSGPHAKTIAAPGAADAALTVAAVDKLDKLADFSSRGPRYGDYALKPDIAAPGVNIVAARAAGTSLGTPVDDHYTTLSGTSMATPHVAGAAALLAQKHPDWTAARLKSGLTATARDDGYGSYEQGAGRVDVGRAVRQQVYADGSLDFGQLAYPQSGPVTRTITYANDSAEPVTLTMTTSLTAHAGGTAGDGMLSVDHDTITVPAGGTAPVQVTLDPARGPATWYEGAVRATGPGGVLLTTAVGADLQAKKVRLTGHVIPPDGATDVTYSGWGFLRVDDRDDLDYGYATAAGQDSTTQVNPGVFSVHTYVSWRDAEHRLNSALVSNPQVDVVDDTTVTLDLRLARRVTVRTPRPTEPYETTFGYRRVPATKYGYLTLTSGALPYGATNMWMLPTEKVTDGTFLSFSQHLLGAPLVTMTADGRAAPALHPQYQPNWRSLSNIPMLSGRLRLPIVDGGHGTAADLQGSDVRGKLVLLDLDDLCATTCTANALDRVTGVAQLGAAGVLGYGGAAARSFLDPGQAWPLYPIPTMGLPGTEGRALLAALRLGNVTADVTGTPRTPYVYSLKFYENGAVPNDLAYSVGERNLVRIDDAYHLDRSGTATETWSPWYDGEPGVPSSVAIKMPAPSRLTEYVGPTSRDVLWNREVDYRYDDPGGVYSHGAGRQFTDATIYSKPGRQASQWGAQPLVPGDAVPTAEFLARFPTSKFCFPCRTGDLFTGAIPIVGSGSDPGGKSAFNWDANNGKQYGGSDEQHLYRDGTEVPLVVQPAVLVIISFPVPTFTLPAEQATYRLTDAYHTRNPLQQFATDVDTEWTFASARPEQGMTSVTSDGICVGWLVTGSVKPCAPVRMLYLRYDLGLDVDNRVRAAGPHQITISGYHDTFDEDPAATLTDLKLWATYDDGAHWQQVRATRHDRAYSAMIDDPAPGSSGDAVGLRVTAQDSEGNTITQTIPRAYGLK